MPALGVLMLTVVAALATEPASLHGVLALSVAAICVALLSGLRPRPPVPAVAGRPARGGEHTVYLRHSDPDAAGRPRPRAPDLG